MDELLWAVARAREWIAKHGGHVSGISRHMDGRWFIRIDTGESNWCPERNLYVTREADLGACPEET